MRQKTNSKSLIKYVFRPLDPRIYAVVYRELGCKCLHECRCEGVREKVG